MVVIETGITEYSYFTNLSYGSPNTAYYYDAYCVYPDGVINGGIWGIDFSHGYF